LTGVTLLWATVATALSGKVEADVTAPLNVVGTAVPTPTASEPEEPVRCVTSHCGCGTAEFSAHSVRHSNPAAPCRIDD
jgi:hypothetical protein